MEVRLGSSVWTSRQTHDSAGVRSVWLIRRALGVGLLQVGQALSGVASALRLDVGQGNGEGAEGVGDADDCEWMERC